MSYQKIYRGQFSNTLDDSSNNPVDQVIRIDINDTTSGSAEESSVVAKFTSSTNLLLVDSDGHSTYEELAVFFFNGQRLRIAGDGALNGDWIVSDVSLTPPTGLTTGKVQFLINAPSPPGSVVGTDITFTNIPADPVIIPLQMDGDPLHISVIDNDEDKFTPIRSKQAEIKIKTGNGIDINTFCEGEDQRYYVEIFVDDLVIFRGFLMIPDMQQDFMPDPNVLLLTATDNLSLLKDIGLVNEIDEVPRFDWRLIDYIRWSLRKTGILQNINIINSVKHGSKTLTGLAAFVSADKQIDVDVTPFFYKGMQFSISGSASNDGTYTVKATGEVVGVATIVITNESLVDEATGPDVIFTDLTSSVPFYEVVALDAKTFEQGIGVCENCYSVLTKILTEDCVLFQYQGEWWIVRIDEIEEIGGVFQYNVDSYDSDGNFLSHSTIIKSKNIGQPDIMHFMNDDAVVIPDRAYSHAKELYKYENPQELLCNIAFLRGDIIGDLPDETIDGKVYNVKNYTPECWRLHKAIDDSNPALDTDGWIKVFSQNGYEKSRVLTINQAPVDAFYKWVNFVRIPMNQGDKFTASVDFRRTAVLTGSGHFIIAVFYIRLYGDDGSFWSAYATSGTAAATDLTPYWKECTSAFSTIDQVLCYFEGESSTDYTTFQNCSVDSAPLPVSGRLEFSLVNSFQADGSDIYFQGLILDYFPLINGSYQRYTGQYHQVSQLGNNKAIRDKQVYMSDSPSLLLKGAMKFFNGTSYELTYGFTDAHNLTPVPFGQIQAFAVWNQYRLSARNFDGEIKRLESETIDDNGKYDGVDLIDKIELTDVNLSTVSRYFLILHYDIDYYLLEMKCFIASLYRTDVGKIYTDTHIFIYTTE